MTSNSSPPAPGSGPPVVIHGGADADEIAAVIAVLSLFSPLSPADERPAAESAWADRARLIGQPARPGPATWIGSGRPR